MTEPKLFTEAEARIRFDHEMTVELRERGLIAPDPELDRWPGVDEIADEFGINLSAMPRVEKALEAALRRGMELAERKELTREWLVKAIIDAGFIYHPVLVDRLHAALVERLK